MQPSPAQVYSFLLEYTAATDPCQPGTFLRRVLWLEQEGGAPQEVRLRDIRTYCCLLETSDSIYTLAYQDIAALREPSAEGPTMPVVRVRIGSLARDANARLARRSRRLQPHAARPGAAGPPTAPRAQEPAVTQPGAAPAARGGERKKGQEKPVVSLEEIERMLAEMR